MLSSWMVYLFLKLDAFISLGIAILIVIGSFMGIVAVVWSNVENEEAANKCRVLIFKKKLWICIVACSLFITILPTTKQAVVIYLLPKIVNNETIRSVPETAGKIIKQKMEEWLEDIEEDTNFKEVEQ